MTQTGVAERVTTGDVSNRSSFIATTFNYGTPQFRSLTLPATHMFLHRTLATVTAHASALNFANAPRDFGSQLDLGWLRLAESAFRFWDNEEDEIWNTL